MLSSMSLFAQGQRTQLSDDIIYEGAWPKGEGVLYSQKDGLILGTFDKGKPQGKCVCYRPNGEVYWGDFKKGKPTGHAYLFRDEGAVIVGTYKNGRFHGVDTLYRVDGSVYIGRFKNGKHVEKIYESKVVSDEIMNRKPSYPRIDFRNRQEEFLKDMEIAWQNYRIGLKQSSGFIYPRFQGGGIDDFTLWVNSRIEVPADVVPSGTSRTVLVEFTVLTDGQVTDVHAVFGSHPLLNETAENAVKKSPKRQSAEHNGEKLSTRMTIPVVFSME